MQTDLVAMKAYYKANQTRVIVRVGSKLTAFLMFSERPAAVAPPMTLLRKLLRSC